MSTVLMNPARLVRRLVASALSLGALAALAQTAPSDWWILGVPLSLLVVAAFTVHVTKLGPQLLARAVWWSNLALGVVLTVLGNGRERTGGVELACTCGVALLAIGRDGLGEATETDAYAPAAFRSSLLLLMVFALADAQTFLLFAVVALVGRGDSAGLGLLMAFSGIAYLIGFLGLYRVALWGALVTVATSALMFVIVTLGIVHVDGELRGFFSLLNGVHVLAASPMLFSVLTGKRLPTPSPLVRRVASIGVIVGLLVLSVVCSALH